jgi:hypothetical protein
MENLLALERSTHIATTSTDSTGEDGNFGEGGDRRLDAVRAAERTC